MAKRWYYKDENGNKVPVHQYKINADDYYTKTMSDSRYYEKSATDTMLAEEEKMEAEMRLKREEVNDAQE